MKQLLILLLYIPPFSLGQVEQANLLGEWSKDGLVGSSAYNNKYNEVWGLVVNN